MTLRTALLPRPVYRIEGQNGSLNFRILRIAGHCDFAALLAVDLNHQRHGVFHQQIAFDLGQWASEIRPGCPSTVQHSSARCGIIGANK